MSELDSLKEELKAQGFKVRVYPYGWEYTSPDGKRFMNLKEADSIQQSHEYVQRKKELGEKMSELQLIYQFVNEAFCINLIYRDLSGEYIAAHTKGDKTAMYYGVTISDAIRKYYEAIEEKESSK